MRPSGSTIVEVQQQGERPSAAPDSPAGVLARIASLQAEADALAASVGLELRAVCPACARRGGPYVHAHRGGYTARIVVNGGKNAARRWLTAYGPTPAEARRRLARKLGAGDGG
jgi:hypothetical protein